MRLGMGGGYYDRTFAFLNRRTSWRAPRLIGIAYSFQRVTHIEPAPHDVRLDAVVTEEGLAYKHIS
jgi:5-formyltetrahydrofolate cyclo-ligase